MSREEAIAAIRRIEKKRSGPFASRIDVDSLPTAQLVHRALMLSEKVSNKRAKKRGR